MAACERQLGGHGRRSQSAFVRGFIDGFFVDLVVCLIISMSQSAFVRGFIDGSSRTTASNTSSPCLNPRSCAASSMA